VNTALGDGLVRFVSFSVDIAVWLAAGTKETGESLSLS
jgi:hypothetical protein